MERKLKHYGDSIYIDPELSDRKIRELFMKMAKRFSGSLRRRGLRPKDFTYEFIVHRNEWPVPSTIAIKATEKAS